MATPALIRARFKEPGREHPCACLPVCRLPACGRPAVFPGSAEAAGGASGAGSSSIRSSSGGGGCGCSNACRNERVKESGGDGD